jgi:hypothetical protein
LTHVDLAEIKTALRLMIDEQDVGCDNIAVDYTFGVQVEDRTGHIVC